MSISKQYNPSEVEDKWYQHWMGKGYFHAQVNPDKEPYTIVIPPPNVTGVLHMGHMHIGGEGVARGYAQAPAATAARFVPDPFSGGEGERLYSHRSQGGKNAP